MLMNEKHKKDLARIDATLLAIGRELLKMVETEEQKKEVRNIMSLLKSEKM